MKKIFFLLLSLLALSSNAICQSNSYDKLEEAYNQFRKEGKNDSSLIVAKKMNVWALQFEGDTSLNYGVSLMYLGNSFKDLSVEDSALFYWNRSLQILDNQNREESLVANICLINLGSLYAEMGDYKTADFYYKKIIEISEKKAWGEHPDYVSITNNLSDLINDIPFQFENSESYFKAAIEINKKFLGEEHPNNILPLYNLGYIYWKLEDYKAAGFYLRKALGIEKKVVTLDEIDEISDQDYIRSLYLVGVFYKEIGDYKAAETIYKEGLDIFKDKPIKGTWYINYAYSLDEMGLLYWEMGDYKAAELYFKKALESYNEFFKERITSSHYNNLGNLYVYLGDYTASEFYYKQALKIIKKDKRVNDFEVELNSDYNSTEVSYAYLLSKTNRERKAYQILSKNYLKKSNKVWANFGWGSLNLENLSFNQKEVYWKKENSFFEGLSFFANEVFQVVPESVGLNYDAALFIKGKLLAEKITEEGLYLEIDELRGKLDVRKRLFAANSSILFSRNTPLRDGQESYMNSLNFQVDSIEKRLRLIWPEYTQQDKSLRITWNQVQQNLEEGEVAIEFVRFKNNSDSLIYYNALVLKKGDSHPKLIKLCAERDLQSNYLAIGYGAYYELIWQPLESALQGIQTIYYAPTGDLYKVPLHEIYSPKDSSDEILPENINPVGNVIFPEYPNTKQEAAYFKNRYTFHRLTSTRFLAMGFKRRVKELKALNMEKVGVIHD